jgi:hypothetical protein
VLCWALLTVLFAEKKRKVLKVKEIISPKPKNMHRQINEIFKKMENRRAR